MARREGNDRPKKTPKSKPKTQKKATDDRGTDFEIYQELARLQEMVFDSFHIPLTAWTLVDEGEIGEQIDIIYETVPESVAKALDILEREREIIGSAEEYAYQMRQSAEQKAARILDETGIVQEAQRQALLIREQVREECELAQQQTLAEIERLQRQARQELEELKRRTLAECDEIQRGADNYAERTLIGLEQQLGEMLKVVRNGRQQVNKK